MFVCEYTGLYSLLPFAYCLLNKVGLLQGAIRKIKKFRPIIYFLILLPVESKQTTESVDTE